MKENYKLVILVLSSCNTPFNKFRKIWERYGHLFPEIKTHFIYAGKDNSNPLSSDLVFKDIKDSYPMNIERTLKGFKYIESKYNYDFLLRTNLSTFWDFERLLNNLNNLPTEKCYQGNGPLPPWLPFEERYYLSGVDTIVNKRMITGVITRHTELDMNIEEDGAMGKFFHKILNAPMIKSNIYFMEHFIDRNKQQILKEIELAKTLNCDHFRIKSVSNRGTIDPFIMETLYEHYYGGR